MNKDLNRHPSICAHSRQANVKDLGTNIHSSFTHSSKSLETTQNVYQQVDEKQDVYLHTMDYNAARESNARYELISESFDGEQARHKGARTYDSISIKL